jgi:hypothetical protein
VTLDLCPGDLVFFRYDSDVHRLIHAAEGVDVGHVGMITSTDPVTVTHVAGATGGVAEEELGSLLHSRRLRHVRFRLLPRASGACPPQSAEVQEHARAIARDVGDRIEREHPDALYPDEHLSAYLVRSVLSSLADPDGSRRVRARLVRVADVWRTSPTASFELFCTESVAWTLQRAGITLEPPELPPTPSWDDIDWRGVEALLADVRADLEKRHRGPLERWRLAAHRLFWTAVVSIGGRPRWLVSRAASAAIDWSVAAGVPVDELMPAAPPGHVGWITIHDLLATPSLEDGWSGEPDQLRELLFGPPDITATEGETDDRS